MAGNTDTKSEKQVKYTGTADRRIISVADWENVGVKGIKDDTVWDASNRKTIPAAEFTKAALEYLESDSGFEITES